MEIFVVSARVKEQAVKKAVAALKKGKVVVCPTDTVYGLLAPALNRKAVLKVMRIKGRGAKKALPVFVKDIAMAKRLARVSPLQEKYMRKVWPGKATLVLESRGKLPKETGAGKTIGLRIPRHKLVRAVLQKARMPLTGTSANLSGKAPILDSKDAIRQFGKRKHKPDILLDAGKLPFSKPSRVVDITGEKLVILRK